MTIKIQPLILCGGSGTRLWPLSRSGFPKQFLNLYGKNTLFQQSVERLLSFDNDNIKPNSPFVICNADHRFIVQEQLREVNIQQNTIFLEPVGRNTAPALTLCALAATENNDDPIIIATPADQVVENNSAFKKAIEDAVHRANLGDIVILGIKPDRADTGYGYIKIRSKLDDKTTAYTVDSFKEKPNEVTAQTYLEEGGYYWNAGIFILKASTWLKAIGFFRPKIMQATQLAWDGRQVDMTFLRPGRKEFQEIPSESIDYAVIEHCPSSQFPISMIPLNAGWSDLGSWDSLWNILPKDKNHNVAQGDVISLKSENTLSISTSRLVSLIGVKNLIVIETADAVLIADKNNSQDVKKLVEQLNLDKRPEHSIHRKVSRPWGWYDSVIEGNKFKVKHIVVNPKASLSLQKHLHRAEHWIVVKGIAEITCGEKVVRLHENQSTFIPLGELHRLANPSDTALEIIEVQSGDYLGEDDIIRFQDNYGRITNEL